MNYDDAMSSARKEGTARRNTRRRVYRVVTWCIGGIAILAALIWLPEGPLQTYARWSKEEPPTPQVRQQRQAVVRESGDCTYARPCKPALERTGVPLKSRVCFDPPVFSNLEGFGFMVSFAGGKEHRYSCTSAQDVADGLCKEGPYDTFRFSPNEGVTPPRHWFTEDPGIVCEP